MSDIQSYLVLSKDPALRRQMRSCLPKEGRLDFAHGKAAALELFRKRRHTHLFIDLRVLEEQDQSVDYTQALSPFRGIDPQPVVIVLSAALRNSEDLKAIGAGANYFMTLPITPEKINQVAARFSTTNHAATVEVKRNIIEHAAFSPIIDTRNPVMKGVFEKIHSVALTKSTVLLVGETGTGKGVLARLIHEMSNRREAPFISVHCGAIPDSLLESELFGHEKGAFTGALRKKHGKFELARGGTVFLDEIGTITPAAQVKLLQILQDGTFERIGGEEVLEANVRIVAATNANLEKMCEEGQFRKDLFYRLNVFPIHIPPLRERLEDVPLFVASFLRKLNGLYAKNILSVHPLVIEKFKCHTWPGNIRELENLVERAYILETETELRPKSFPIEMVETQAPAPGHATDTSMTLSQFRRKGLEDIEKFYIRQLLTRHRGRIKDSADSAGITTRQLHKLMTKYGIHKEEFKALHIT
ncbi:sigma-54 dependent transcriptional regulator [Desulfatiglans anilini]|uniref:sigma-54 dependent transcriptional regulator n=1 Tax=Desulfatiglans anilini TaxID=90728 RepID=UPI000429AD92|nr:sigma-54 dependent transcriptional regulator [Desulfatiglans anilini]